MSPATGPLTGGTPVTVTGTNVLALSRVTIGNVDLADLVVVSETQLTGTSAAATDPGQRDIVVVSSSHGTGSCDGCFAYLVEFVYVSAGADGGLPGCLAWGRVWRALHGRQRSW